MTAFVPDDPSFADFGRSEAEVTTAREAATRRLREAIDRFFVAPADLDSFPATAAGDELAALVERHGVSLAAAELSSYDGAVSKRVQTRASEARAWIREVKAGEIDLSPLTRRVDSGGGRQIFVVGDKKPRVPDSVYDPYTLAGL